MPIKERRRIQEVTPRHDDLLGDAVEAPFYNERGQKIGRLEIDAGREGSRYSRQITVNIRPPENDTNERDSYFISIGHTPRVKSQLIAHEVWCAGEELPMTDHELSGLVPFGEIMKDIQGRLPYQSYLWKGIGDVLDCIGYQEPQVTNLVDKK